MPRWVVRNFSRMRTISQEFLPSASRRTSTCVQMCTRSMYQLPPCVLKRSSSFVASVPCRSRCQESECAARALSEASTETQRKKLNKLSVPLFFVCVCRKQMSFWDVERANTYVRTLNDYVNPGIASASQHMAFALLNKSAANIHDYGRRLALFVQLAERLTEGAVLMLEAAQVACAGTQEARLLGCLGGIRLRLPDSRHQCRCLVCCPSEGQPGHTTPCCSRKLDSSASSENSQPNSATNLTRQSDYRSVLTEEERVQKACQCHLGNAVTWCFFVHCALSRRRRGSRRNNNRHQCQSD